MSDRTPERGEIALRDTWKLEDIYATQAAWEADYEKASALLAAFPAYEGRLGVCVNDVAGRSHFYLLEG